METTPDVEPAMPIAFVTGFTNVGVVIVGEVERTFEPEPVEVVTPVPPFKTGSGVPDRVTVNVPVEVIGPPATERNVGTVMLTEVTVPVVGVVQVIGDARPPAEVRT